MPRPAPSYIPIEMIAAAPLKHSWDDWDPYPALGEPDEQVLEQLQKTSFAAVFAFALGCTEWVLYRLMKHSSDPMPWEYVDAQWARLVDWNLGYVWDPDREHMDGPVQGPIDVAIRQITNCNNALEEGGGEVDAAMIARVAEYILPDASVFHAWQQSALKRLCALYPRREENPFGPAVPREALDASVPMTAESGVKLAEAYVKTLDFSKNEFLDPEAQGNDE